MGQKVSSRIPNTITILNAICGLIAIIHLLGAYRCSKENPEQCLKFFSFSVFMIFLAMFFDTFDGLTARLLHAESMKGIQMDSLSDIISFGAAPAILMVAVSKTLLGWELPKYQQAAIIAPAAIFLAGAALRLADYNVNAMKGEKGDPNTFKGLPSPGAAAALCIAILVSYDSRFRILHTGYFIYLLPLYAGFLGIMMVSPIPYAHVGRWLADTRWNKAVQLLFVGLVVFLFTLRLAGLSIVVFLYILSGPVMLLAGKLKRK